MPGRVSRRRMGFSLVELLVVIGIIALLISILLPAMAKARRSAQIVQCAAQLRQLATAFTNYIDSNRGTVFWRGTDSNPDLNTAGMEWYTWGGRPNGNPNHWQADIFNTIDPRPLNEYLGIKTQTGASTPLDTFKIFHCPADDETSWWSETSGHFEWVGNSYNFNAVGNPDGHAPGAGLAGKKISTAVRDSSHYILFLDAGLVYPGDWHRENKGNVCFCDSHVAFLPRPCSISSYDRATGTLTFPNPPPPPSADYTWGD
jgi:prepilin-type processing-associated H-X9-DG protein